MLMSQPVLCARSARIIDHVAFPCHVNCASMAIFQWAVSGSLIQALHNAHWRVTCGGASAQSCYTAVSGHSLAGFVAVCSRTYGCTIVHYFC